MSRIREIVAALDIPVIAAPMFLVSNPAMALACCAEGVMGSFPAHGTRDRETFAAWLVEMREGMKRLRDAPGGERVAPWAVNLVVHPSNPRMAGDLALCIEHQVPVILTSKGAPGDVFRQIHDYGGVTLHDVASQRHAEKAIEAGTDGVIAVAGGAGGHTGTINPFALLNEIRRIFDGVVVLAGGMTTGRDVLAAQAMGADLVYLGTRFIATREASASDPHKAMIVDSRATDVFFSAAIDGAPANWLTKSLLAAGVDLDVLRTTLPGKIIAAGESRKRWKDIWTAGHGVGNIDDVPTTVELCRRLKREYTDARAAFGRTLSVSRSAP